MEKTLVLNLKPILIEPIDKFRAKMTIETEDASDYPEETSFILACTDDPTMNSAGDWTQLGYGRLKIGMRKALKLSHENNWLTYQGELVEYEMIVPDRPKP